MDGGEETHARASQIIGKLLAPEKYHTLSTLAMPAASPELILMYVGPDQMMPVTSFLSSLVGVILIFWTKIRMFFQKINWRNWRNWRLNPFRGL